MKTWETCLTSGIVFVIVAPISLGIIAGLVYGITYIVKAVWMN